MRAQLNSISLGLLLVSCAQRERIELQYEAPIVPADFEETIQATDKQGKAWVIHPRELYAEGYSEGWTECLRAFVEDGRLEPDFLPVQEWVVSAQGREEGHVKCHSRLAELVRRFGFDSARAALRAKAAETDAPR